MAYIGKEPTIGNFQKCDAISVVNGQAAYTLQVGGTNVVPESANHMLVSLNGILQAPTDSFTVSGSTLTFASNLATGDVIDFVMILGNVLDLGVPSDNTVTAAKLNNDIISGTTALTSAPDDTDEFLVSDAGTLKRIDYSLIKSDPTHVLLQTQTVSSAVAQVDFTSNIDSTYKVYMFDVFGVHPTTDSAQFQIRFFQGGSVDTGSVYDFGYIRARSDNSTANIIRGENADVIRLLEDCDSQGSATANGRLFIYNPTLTDRYTQCQYHFSGTYQGNNNMSNAGAGRIQEDAAVDGVRFYFNSGNIETGTFKLYGVN